jgi:hypothetical protein
MKRITDRRHSLAYTERRYREAFERCRIQFSQQAVKILIDLQTLSYIIFSMLIPLILDEVHFILHSEN